MDRPLPFLNIQIRNKPLDNQSISNEPVDLEKSNLSGAGIYTLYFRKRLVYIGSYFPKKGDIRSQRWKHHLGTVTMRGYPVHIQNNLWTDIHKSGLVCDIACNREFLSDFRNGLDFEYQEQKYNRHEQLYKKGRRNRTSEEKNDYNRINKLCMSIKGNAPDASSRRIRFANMYWDDFKPKPHESIESIKNMFSNFEFYYIRDNESPDNVDTPYKDSLTYRKHIKDKVERKSVSEFNPIINNEAVLENAKVELTSNKVQQTIMKYFKDAINTFKMLSMKHR